jgi:hypothetical protein
MSLYPKRLKSLDDLECEKKRVQKQIAELQEEKLFSKESLLAQLKENAKGGGQGGLLGMLGKFAPAGLVPVVGKVTELIKNKQQKQSSQPTAKTPIDGEPEKKNIFVRAGKEILMGYLKWKAIELSIKGVRYLYKKRVERREMAKNQ